MRLYRKTTCRCASTGSLYTNQGPAPNSTDKAVVANSGKTHLTSIQLKCTETLSKKEATATATSHRPTGFGILGLELLHRAVQCTQGTTARSGVPIASQDIPGLVMETLLGSGTLISLLWDNCGTRCCTQVSDSVSWIVNPFMSSCVVRGALEGEESGCAQSVVDQLDLHPKLECLTPLNTNSVLDNRTLICVFIAV